MKFRQIGHMTSQYGQLFFALKKLVHGMGLLLLKLRHWLYLDNLFLNEVFMESSQLFTATLTRECR